MIYLHRENIEIIAVYSVWNNSNSILISPIYHKENNR